MKSGYEITEFLKAERRRFVVKFNWDVCFATCKNLPFEEKEMIGTEESR